MCIATIGGSSRCSYRKPLSIVGQNTARVIAAPKNIPLSILYPFNVLTLPAELKARARTRFLCYVNVICFALTTFNFYKCRILLNLKRDLTQFLELASTLVNLQRLSEVSCFTFVVPERKALVTFQEIGTIPSTIFPLRSFAECFSHYLDSIDLHGTQQA